MDRRLAPPSNERPQQRRHRPREAAHRGRILPSSEAVEVSVRPAVEGPRPLAVGAPSLMVAVVALTSVQPGPSVRRIGDSDHVWGGDMSRQAFLPSITAGVLAWGAIIGLAHFIPGAPW
jgi:hypothetical protein